MLPSEVRRELTAPGDSNLGAVEVQPLPWLETRSVKSYEQVERLLNMHGALHRAEAEAITLALEADLLIIDEGVGRRVAADLQIPITGLLGLLLIAKEQGLIAAVKPMLNDLRAKAGFCISQSLYQAVLDQAAEGRSK